MRMSKKVALSLVGAGLVFAAVGCVATDSETTTDQGSKRYTTEQQGSDTVLKDNVTGLMWTNSSQGCKPLMDLDAAATAKTANEFCTSLSFGLYDDWRLATVDEMRDLEINTDKNGFELFYKNPICARVLASKPDGVLTSITTTNNLPVGRIVGHKLPAGTRCVRDKE